MYKNKILLIPAAIFISNFSSSSCALCWNDSVINVLIEVMEIHNETNITPTEIVNFLLNETLDTVSQLNRDITVTSNQSLSTEDITKLIEGLDPTTTFSNVILPSSNVESSAPSIIDHITEQIDTSSTATASLNNSLMQSDLITLNNTAHELATINQHLNIISTELSYLDLGATELTGFSIAILLAIYTLYKSSNLTPNSPNNPASFHKDVQLLIKSFKVMQDNHDKSTWENLKGFVKNHMIATSGSKLKDVLWAIITYALIKYFQGPTKTYQGWVDGIKKFLTKSNDKATEELNEQMREGVKKFEELQHKLIDTHLKRAHESYKTVVDWYNPIYRSATNTFVYRTFTLINGERRRIGWIKFLWRILSKKK